MKLSTLFKASLIIFTFIQFLSLLAEHSIVERYDREATRKLALEQIQLVYNHQHDNLLGQLFVGNFDHAKNELTQYANENQLSVSFVGPDEILPPLLEDEKIASKEFILKQKDRVLAKIRIEKKLTSVFAQVKMITIFFMFAKLILLTSIFTFLYWAMRKWVLSPIEKIVSESSGLQEAGPEQFIPEEIVVLANKMRDSIQLEKESIRNHEITKIASQVAHDIRSPLEMLKGLQDEMMGLPVQTQQRVQLSINRIEEITFNLLKTQREASLAPEAIRSQDLKSLVQSVLTEKKIEYRKRLEVQFLEHDSLFELNLFSKIQKNVLKSILSNIVNNSIDAFDSMAGVVEIWIAQTDRFNTISIKDNGKGISGEVASKIFTKGLTTKLNGNGLGLYNAKNDLKAFGGELTFISDPILGTTFTISLPKASAPMTFVSSIDVTSYQKIIILDDDPSFHDIWGRKLAGLSIEIFHLFSVQEMLERFKTLSSNTLLLSDFELMDKDLDGIDTILHFGHSRNSILVTARSDEESIQLRCEEAAIKLLPKTLVSNIPVIFSEVSSIARKVVLIDDDRLVHINWTHYCKKESITLTSFKTIDEFLCLADSFDHNVLIFIDSSLGENIRGEVESQKIFMLGFSNLFITTGYSKDDINRPKWIKEIYPKGPEMILEGLKLVTD